MDTNHQAHASDDQPGESEINEILRRKRKLRGQQACYPCRQRKVKCNNETPCQRCIERRHPDLCRYQPASKRQDVKPLSPPGPSVADDGRRSVAERNQLWSKLETVERLLQEVKVELRGQTSGTTLVTMDEKLQIGLSISDEGKAREANTSAPGIQASTALAGEFVHLGDSSVPAMAIALGRGSNDQVIQDIVGKSVLPLFGLDNESATYPFVDLWGLPPGSTTRVEELCKLIPVDADCRQFLRQYRDTAHILFPGVVDIHQLESDLTQFLIERSRQNGHSHNYIVESSNVYGKTLHWIGLLFACLASGCQCSELSRKERQLTSQVYVCCAYECLRIVNYLSHSTTVDIQTLLVLGNVIANNMNAGVAWSLLGLTIRLAQTLGLHQPSPTSTPTAEMVLREEAWWRIIWQDSLLSITYDRASSASTMYSHHHLVQTPDAGEMSYVECMKWLCKIGLDIVRERAVSPDFQRELSLIIKHRDELTGIMKQAAHHLREVTACRSMKDHLEYWNLYLHISYVTSELYRPTLKRKKAETETAINLRETCVDSLADTVDAFLGLQSLTSFAKTSWAAVHRALSSALLLGILREPVKNQRVWTLLERFLTVMSALDSDLGSFELPAPVSRSISALRRLTGLRDGTQGTPHSQGSAEHVKGRGDEGEIFGTVERSSLAVSSASESSGENSPYAVRDRILWGSAGYSISST